MDVFFSKSLYQVIVDDFLNPLDVLRVVDVKVDAGIFARVESGQTAKENDDDAILSHDGWVIS